MQNIMKLSAQTRHQEQKTLIILSVFLIVLILFSASFLMVLFDKSFYDNSFEKLGVYDELGVQGTRNTLNYLINYLTSENTEINKTEQLTVFEPEEKSHLQDVKNIISWVKATSIAAAVLLFAFIMRLSTLAEFRPNIRRILVCAGISTLGVLAVLFILSLNFPAFFNAFHQVLFPQGNYSFPDYYLLIKMFPQGFFKGFANKMFFHTAIMGLIMLFLGHSFNGFLRKTR